MKKIILLSGKAESGKSSVAKILKRLFEVKGYTSIVVSFASYLKYICREYYGWDGKKSTNGREILQYVGTDVARKIEPDFWVNALWDFIRVFCSTYDYVLIDDVRFKNEAEFFKKKNIPYILIRVYRDDFISHLNSEQLNHQSEIDLDDYPPDIFIGSKSGLENLEAEIEKHIDNILS